MSPTKQSTLGDALTDLSTSADGLSEELLTLNRAIDNLQASTERWSENTRATSESLSQAAASLSELSEQPGASAGPSGSGFAPADD